MQIEPIQALQAASRPLRPQTTGPVMLVAGATGTLGNEVLRRLAGTLRFDRLLVLAREPFTDGLRGVSTLQTSGQAPQHWPLAAADAGVIMFDPPRLFHDRERALWTPQPADLVPVAAWMRRCGASTLAVVLPHAQGRLPEALKHGLAGLDEQAVSALGFDRVIFVRSAQRPLAQQGLNLLERIARWMLSVFRYMVPSSEQPVRAVKVAEFVDAALQFAPPGIHVAAPELVRQASQGDVRGTVARWLGR